MVTISCSGRIDLAVWSLIPHLFQVILLHLVMVRVGNRI